MGVNEKEIVLKVPAQIRQSVYVDLEDRSDAKNETNMQDDVIKIKVSQQRLSYIYLEKEES